MTTSLRKVLFGSLVISDAVNVLAQEQDEYKKWLKKEQEKFQQYEYPCLLKSETTESVLC